MKMKRGLVFIVLAILTLKTIWADVWVKTEKGTQPKILTEQQWEDKKAEVVGSDTSKIIKTKSNFGDKCPYNPEEERFIIEAKGGKQLWRHYIGINETDYWEMIKFGS